MNRRGLILGLASTLVAAPAIVRAASLMPIRGVVMPVPWWSYRTSYMFGERRLHDMQIGDIVGHYIKNGDLIWQPVIQVHGDGPGRVVFFGGRIEDHSTGLPSSST